MLDEVLDKHKQDFDEIRRLCLLCHGLDLTSTHLFNSPSYPEPSSRTRSMLHSMLSSSLLNLAVSIRINIYQGVINDYDAPLDRMIASIYQDKELIEKSVTIKDVCDKIIHADTITKPIFPKDQIEPDVKITFQFKGVHRNKAWTLDICLDLFAEAVLKLLDEIEKTDDNPLK